MSINCVNCYQFFQFLINKKNNLEEEIKSLTDELFETNKEVLYLIQHFENENNNLIKSDIEKSEFLENLKKTNKNQLEKIKIQEKALIHADKMTSLGQLVAGIAHEINNPNTYIRANIELLSKYWNIVKDDIECSKNDKKNMVCDDFKNVLNSMLSGTERIMEIIKGLKFFSKHEITDFKDFDIFECIEEAFKLVKNEFYINKIEFKNKIPKNRFIVNGSKQQIEQVFINLYLNAVNAMKNDKAKENYVEVYTNGVVDNFMNLSIKDNGSGIKESNMEKIFNPFFTTHLEDGGTGLGLSIVYGIIKEHKGSISVVSELSKGTEFLIKLPYSYDVKHVKR